MSSTMRECSSTRKDLIQVHEYCPQRAYVELTVPADTKAVVSAQFNTVSRDQGWADSKEVSYTWFQVELRRPGAISGLSATRIQHNRAGNPEFFNATTRWDVNSQSRYKTWLQMLRPGDIIQIIPKAVYAGWVNIVQEANIKIEYQSANGGQGVSVLSSLSRPIYTRYFQHLRSEQQQIRVLVVKPGAYDDTIQAYFENESLSGPPSQCAEFHALSYCWGDSSNCADIVLEIKDEFCTESTEENLFSITRPVEMAIRRLRSEKMPLRIWIDAVCINQHDDEERTHQVSIMGNIYSRADMVHVWLDGEIRGIEVALRVIRDIYNYHQRQCPGGEECHCSGTRHTLNIKDLETLISEQGESSFSSMFEIFNQHATRFKSYEVDAAGGPGNIHLSLLMENFFQHPWFQRVWVIQEVILAQQVAVHCGVEMISWQELVMVNELLDAADYKGQIPHLRGSLIMPPVWGTLVSYYGRNQVELQAANNEETDTTKRSLSKPVTILETFLAALDLKATDQRDKLFALLPFGQETRITNQIPRALFPNYRKSLASVVTDFTRWWIMEYGSLDILSFIHCQPARAWQRMLCNDDPRTEMIAERPTWAIGTDGYSKWSKMTLLRQFSFQLLGETAPDEKLLCENEDPMILSLHGCKVTTIVALSHPPMSMVYSYRGTEAKGSDMSTVFHRMFDPCGYSGRWTLSGSATRDTECTNLGEWRSGFTDHLRTHVNYFPKPELLVLNPKDNGTSEDYWTDKYFSCSDKCFFLASNGLYGLCPWTVREGDIIGALKGAKVPYLLRPVAYDGVRTDIQHYELIGECFVNGVMDGENADDYNDRMEIISLV